MGKPLRKDHNSGGLRNPPGGRPQGAVGAIRRTAIEMAHDGGGHPFEYLLQIARDVEEDSDRRFAAAQACLPYCAHRLATQEITIKSDIDRMTPQQRVEYAASLAKKIQHENPDIELPRLTVIDGECEHVS